MDCIHHKTFLMYNFVNHIVIVCKLEGTSFSYNIKVKYSLKYT